MQHCILSWVELNEKIYVLFFLRIRFGINQCQFFNDYYFHFNFHAVLLLFHRCYMVAMLMNLWIFRFQSGNVIRSTRWLSWHRLISYMILFYWLSNIFTVFIFKFQFLTKSAYTMFTINREKYVCAVEAEKRRRKKWNDNRRRNIMEILKQKKNCNFPLPKIEIENRNCFLGQRELTQMTQCNSNFAKTS